MSVLIIGTEEQLPDSGGDDDQLLAQLLHPNPRLENRLFLSWKKKCMGTMMKRFRCDETDAEEVYIDAFARMIQNIRSKRLSPPLLSRLDTYCISICNNIIRKRYTQSGTYIPTEESDLLHLMNEKGLDREDVEFEDETWAALLKRVGPLLQAMGNKCQEVLKGKFWYGYSHKEMMEEYGIPSEAASRQKLFKCIKKIRDALLP